MAIVDRFGRPIQQDQLTDPQTARIGTLHWEIAGHPSRGLTPAKLAGILENAEEGNLIEQSDLFEDMEEKDAHLFAEVSKRRRSVLGVDWSIEPPRNALAREKKAAAAIEEILRRLDFENILFDTTDAIGKGFACQEIRWERHGGEWVPADIDHRPQRWFTVLPWDRDDVRLRDPDDPYGAELWPFGWILHKHRAKSGYVSRSALFRVLAWPYLFKNYSVRDLAEFLEIYGLPLRVGKYPAGASDREKSTLLKAVTAIGHSAAGIMPDSMAVEFQQAAEGSADPFKAMLEWCEASESKAIVGQTLTAQPGSHGGGSHAMAKVHDEVRWDITVSDVRQIGPTLTRDLVYPIGMLNGWISDPSRCPRLVFDVSEIEDLQTYAQALPKLVGIGMKIPERWAHERLGIPEPAQDDEVLKAGAPAPAPASAPSAPSATAQTAALSTQAANPDTVDQQVQRLAESASPEEDHLINQIKALVDQAQSLQDVRDGLMHLYPAMSPQQFTQAMQKALAAAVLAGRYEILQETG